MKNVMFSFFGFRPGNYSILLYVVIFLLSIHLYSTAQGVNQLWGMTPEGGKNGDGTIFSLDGNGNNLQVRNNFTSNPGKNPIETELMLYNDKLYGMTSKGGAYDAGVIFELDPNTNTYNKIYDFNGTDGGYPEGSLILVKGKIYGTTPRGGANNSGVLFEWDPISNVFSKQYDFTNVPGNQLNTLNGILYGTTKSGGANNKGTIFEWDPNGNIFSIKIDFDGINGANPNGGMTIVNNKFYGMTVSGGSSNKGVVYEWDPVSNNCSERFNEGSYQKPAYYNGKFYWVNTSSESGYGTNHSFREWDPVSNICAYYAFLRSFDRELTVGSLTVKNGKLYEVTHEETNSQNFENTGSIWEFDLVTKELNRKKALIIIGARSPMVHTLSELLRFTITNFMECPNKVVLVSAEIFLNGTLTITDSRY